MAVLTGREYALSEIVETLQSRNFIQADGADSVARFVQVVLDARPDLLRERRRSLVASAVLPSYQGATFATDVRLDFEAEEKLRTAVPVVVGAIGTDTDEHLTFQLSEAQARDLLRKLQAAVAKLEAAQRWLSRREPSGG